MDYHSKYIKYKTKYLLQTGGRKLRRSPSEKASFYKKGTVKEGNDGDNWIVAVNKKGVKRWKKVDSKD